MQQCGALINQFIIAKVNWRRKKLPRDPSTKLRALAHAESPNPQICVCFPKNKKKTKTKCFFFFLFVPRNSVFHVSIDRTKITFFCRRIFKCWPATMCTLLSLAEIEIFIWYVIYFQFVTYLHVTCRNSFCMPKNWYNVFVNFKYQQFKKKKQNIKIIELLQGSGGQNLGTYLLDFVIYRNHLNFLQKLNLKYLNHGYNNQN